MGSINIISSFSDSGGTNRKMLVDGDRHGQVDVLSSALPTGAATESTLATIDGKITACDTGSIAGTVTANQGGTWNINNISGTISLPTGAATESTLSTINGKLTACDTDNVTLAGPLGQAVMASSVPVVIASNQSTLPVSAASLPLPSGAATEATLSSIDGKITACDTGNIAGTVTANQGGIWNINNISGTISLPTGAATEATLSTINGKITACDTGNVTLVGPFGQAVMASSLPVAIASDQGAVPISAASLPLPTGAATEATLSTIDGKITACDTGNISGTVAATQSGTWNVNNISGTVSLPTGAATEAKQDAQETTLNAIQTAVEVLDDWDDGSDRAKVSLEVNNAGLAQESGGNLATIAGDTTSLDGKVSTCDTDDVQQATHDDLNCNANLQVGDADNSETNPAFIGHMAESSWTTPTNIVTTYDDGTSYATSQTSGTITREPGCFYADISIELSKANTPTDLRIYIREVGAGAGSAPVRDGWQSLWIYDDTIIGSGYHENLRVRIPADDFDIYVVGTGLSSTATFTIDAFRIKQISAA